MTIGESLRKFRKQNGITQQDIASRMGISRVNYNRYENNFNTPNVKILIKLADFYDVTLDELVGRNQI